MIKEDFEKFKQTLDIEAFKLYYYIHKEDETVKHYGISHDNFKALKKEYNIKIPNVYRQQGRLEKYKQKTDDKLRILSIKVPFDSLVDYYDKQNHTLQECLVYFNVTNSEFIKLLKYYNYHKSNQSHIQNIKKTKLFKYGDENYNNRDKAALTCITKYGINNPFKDVEKIRKSQEGIKKGCGCKNSSPNTSFAQLLEQNNITYSREFALGKYSYDFKVGNILIEINPTATHNSTWSPFPSRTGLDKYYHRNKSKFATLNNFRCIHIWDWDNTSKIINLLKNNITIYARKCELRDVSIEECNNFLESYHLQGTCKGQEYRLGLFYNNELVQLMTFGRPRYSKIASWELLRLCTKPTYRIIGGSEKLFKHFLTQSSATSIVSYCDKCKFNGDVYLKLGFKLIKNSNVSKHWYNINTKTHITDNLLRQQGFDRLLGHLYGKYGKGTSNTELMKSHGFVEVYDCGQATYLYNID